MSTIKVTNIQNPSSGTNDIQIDPSGNVTIDPLYVDAGNNRVGVGTSSPSSLLHVKSTGAASALVEGGGTSGDTILQIKGNANNYQFRVANAAAQYGIGLYDVTNAAYRYFVNATGNVGIGTASPAQLLDVAGDVQFCTGETAGLVKIKGSSFSQINIEEDLYIDTTPSDGFVAFRRNNGASESCRIDGSGRLLVGTSTSRNASAPLQAYQASGNNWLWVESNSLGNDQFARGVFVSGSRSGQVGVYKHSGITNPAGFLYLQRESGGDVWIWTDNPGDLRISNIITNIGTTSGTVVGTQTSDKRIKNILGTVEYGLETVKQLETVRYSLKVRPEVEKIGFIAQQVLPLVPESVFDTNEPIEGEPEGAPTKLGMEYVALIPVLVNAIKELSAEVDALKAELQTS